MTELRFAVIGINHAHIYGQVDCLLRAGARVRRLPCARGRSRQSLSRRTIRRRRASPIARACSRTTAIALIVSAGIPADRAPLGVEVMRHGKDFMSDKPGMTSLDQLAEVRRVQAETKRIYSICYSEHFETRSTVKAGELVAPGAIGKVVNTVGLGPHKLKNLPRPDWFFERETQRRHPRPTSPRTSASSSCSSPTRSMPRWSPRRSPTAPIRRRPSLQDFGEMLLRAGDVTGYVRVDWFTPDGLPHLGRRPADHPRHRGLYRAAQIYRHRRPARQRPSVPGRRQGHARASIAPVSSCPMAASSSPTSATAPRPRCRRRAASRPWSWR